MNKTYIKKKECDDLRYLSYEAFSFLAAVWRQTVITGDMY